MLIVPPRRREMAAVVIGASAGATEALSVVLPALPCDFAAPIFMTIHVPNEPRNLVVEILAPCSSLPVSEVEDKSPIEAGRIYVAPPDYHVLVESDGRLSLSVAAPVHFSRPSIDVMFDSAAMVYGPRLVGVLLSGASEDGAHGLATVRALGGQTIVQDPATAAAKTMPRSAIRLGAAEHVLGLAEIVTFLTVASTHAREAIASNESTRP